jgi:hypothetical protein
MGTLSLVSCSGSESPERSTVIKFASLDGAQVVPVATASTLTASGSLTVDTATGIVSGNMRLDFTGIIETNPTTTITEVSVYEGTSGANDDKILSLVEGRFGVWRVPAAVVLTAAHVNAFINGNLYFNVDTEAFPEGEIRGQINEPPPTGDIIRGALMEGSEEIPSISTQAFGYAELRVNTTSGALTGEIGIQPLPLTEITAVNVYEGGFGVYGRLVTTLTGSQYTWSVPPGTVLTPVEVISFSAGNFYVNVNTVANPNGEIRGQIDHGPITLPPNAGSDTLDR